MAITIVSYQPTWPDQFLTLGQALRQALGPFARRIDHIGSTAVPRLAAKDIIDIQVTVENLSDDLKQRLTDLGYRWAAEIQNDHRPAGDLTTPDDHWQKWYFRPPKTQRPTHLHVRVEGRTNQRFPLLIRDFLRTHHHYAQAYARLKTRLAQVTDDTILYSDTKDPAIDLIYFAAQNWAQSTHWNPGPSDV